MRGWWRLAMLACAAVLSGCNGEYAPANGQGLSAEAGPRESRLTILNPDERLDGRWEGVAIRPTGFQVSPGGDRAAFEEGIHVGTGADENGVYVADFDRSQALWITQPQIRLADSQEPLRPLGVRQIAFSPSGERLLIHWAVGRASSPSFLEVYDADTRREAIKIVEFPAMGFTFIDEDTLAFLEAERCDGCIRDMTAGDLDQYSAWRWNRPDSSLFGGVSALRLSTNEITPLLLGPAPDAASEAFSEPTWAMGSPGLITQSEGWYLWRLAVPETCGEPLVDKPYPAGLAPDLYRVEFDRDDVTRYDPTLCSYTIADVPENPMPVAVMERALISIANVSFDPQYLINGRDFEAPEIMKRELDAMALGEPYAPYIAFSRRQIIGYSGQSHREIEFLICDVPSLECRFHVTEKVELTPQELR